MRFSTPRGQGESLMPPYTRGSVPRSHVSVVLTSHSTQSVPEEADGSYSEPPRPPQLPPVHLLKRFTCMAPYAAAPTAAPPRCAACPVLDFPKPTCAPHCTARQRYCSPHRIANDGTFIKGLKRG